MTSNKQPPISSDDLHAYADGKLSSGRVAEVEAYLAEHPAAARQVEDYRAIDRALHQGFDPVLDEPIPAAHVDLALHRRPRLAVPMAAAIAGLLIGVSAGWLAPDYPAHDRMAAAELAARTRAAYAVYAPDDRHPVEVRASESEHLAAWLSKRMDMTFRIPRLAGLGFTLVGGRLMIGETAPAAMLMYENGQGRRLVLYLRNDLPGTGRAEMRYERGTGAGVLYWTDGPRGFGLSGGFSEQELMAAGQVVRAQYAS